MFLMVEPSLIAINRLLRNVLTQPFTVIVEPIKSVAVIASFTVILFTSLLFYPFIE